MKRKIITSLLALCAIAGQAQNTKNSSSAPLDSVIIEGVVTNIADGTHLPLMQEGANSMQETIVKDGKFRIAVLPQQEEETYALIHGDSFLSIYAKPGMKIKVKGDGATSVPYWDIESNHFDQKENNAYNQFVKDKLPDYYELDNKLRLVSGRRFDNSLTQEERDKAIQETRELHQQLEALRKEKYNAAILDFMKERPFSKRMIEEIWMIANRDQIPSIVEKAREIFKKTPQEAMNDERVAETKAFLKYADYRETPGEQNADIAKSGEQIAAKAKIGEQMKDFTLFDREGNKHQLSEFKGKYTILEFTFVGCGGCVFIKPFLDEFYKRNKDKAEVVGIYHDTVKGWMAEEERYKASYHEWNDHARSAVPVAAYGIKVYPTFVIIAPNGKILDIKEGAGGLLKALEYIPDAEVEKKLKEALK